MLVNVVTYYCLALPIGYNLVINFNFKLEGLWFGFAIGLTFQIITYFCLIQKSDWDQIGSESWLLRCITSSFAWAQVCWLGLDIKGSFGGSLHDDCILRINQAASLVNTLTCQPIRQCSTVSCTCCWLLFVSHEGWVGVLQANDFLMYSAHQFPFQRLHSESFS